MRAKQFAIGLGIALSLLLSVYTGVNIFSPPPDAESYYEESNEYEQRRKEAKTVQEKQRIAREQAAHKKRYDAAVGRYQKHMFYVAYPVGMAAIIAGYFLSVPAVGAGLMFGGIFTLAEGCYSYWDKMTALVRFGSVVLTLCSFAVLGYWRGRPDVATNETELT